MMGAEAENELLLKRFRELYRKSENGYFTFTDFLGLSEQSIFARLRAEIPALSYTAFGGADGTERVIIRFGNAEELGYEEAFPIKVILCRPKSIKFAEKLSHRDFLGAIMNLGIERTEIGDIAVGEEQSYIFAKDDMADYIVSSLTKIRRTDVVCSITDELPEGSLYKTERVKVQASGERIDAIVAKVFHISRDDSLALFRRGLVFINGAECTNNSKPLKEGDVVSARGYGRFIYRGYETLSKKGKLNVEVDLYV